MEIAKLTWKGAGLKLADDAVSPPATLDISDAGALRLRGHHHQPFAPALRDEVQSLLQWHESTGEFLETPAVRVADLTGFHVDRLIGAPTERR